MHNVTISNLNFAWLYGRNVITATMYDMEDKPLVNDSLANLLSRVKQQKLTLMNPTDVLEEVVMKFGAGA